MTTRLSLLGGDPIARVRSDEDKSVSFVVYTTEVPDASVRDAADPVLLLSRDERTGLRTDSGHKLDRDHLADLNAALKDAKAEPPEGLTKAVAWCREALEDRTRTELAINEGCLVPVRPVGDAQRYFVSGPSGAGKSTYVSRLVTEYRRVDPDTRLFLYSRLHEDAVLDRLTPIRVPIDASLLTAEYDIEAYRDAIVVFDDVDTIADSKLLKLVQKRRDDLLTVGRHANVTVISTSHQSMDWSRTRQSLLEASAVTVFPRQSGAHHIKALLTKYCGMSAAQVKLASALPSRWVTITMRAPRMILHEKGVVMLT